MERKRKKDIVWIYAQELSLNDWGNGRGCYSRGPYFPILQASKEGTFVALAKKGGAACSFIDFLPDRHSVLSSGEE